MDSGRGSAASRDRVLLIVDVVVAIGFAVGAGMLTWVATGSALAVAAALGSTLPIAFRRQAPGLTLIALVAARTVHSLVDPTGETVFQLLAMLIALYTLAAVASVRMIAAGAMLALAGGIFQVSRFPEPNWAGDTIPILVLWSLALVAGRTLNRREDETARLRREQERLERERDRTLRDERLRIARELHDIVTHSVTVMVLHAGVLRRSNGRVPLEQDRSLETIETVGRQAVLELQRLLSLLRDEATPEDAPGGSDLGELDAVADRLRAAGLEVRIRHEGDLTHLPAAITVCVVRIVQEALTNVLKHASAKRVEVLLSRRADGLEVVVVDDGVGLPPTGSGRPGGHGVLGMRERIRLFGGSLEITAAPEGGTKVRAYLPGDAA